MKNKYIYILIILFPIVDLITAIGARFGNFPISLGMIYKSFIFILIFIYLIINKKLFKPINIIYFILLILYITLFFASNSELIKIKYLKVELINLLKYIYFPLLLIGLYNIYEDGKLDFKSCIKTLLIILGIYLLLLFIPNILEIGNNTYELDYLKGQVGWFYSANELGGILIILLPLIYYFLKNNNIVLYFTYLVLSCYCLTSIGTKAAFVGLITTFFIILLVYFIFSHDKKRIVITMLSIIIIALFTSNSYALYNQQKNVEYLNNPSVNNKNTNIIVKNDIKIDVNNSFIQALFSSRLDYFENTINIYAKSGIMDKLFGIGFSNTIDVNNYTIEKNIEIDLLDYFFHYGIIGFIIMMLPFGYIMFILVTKKILLSKNNIVLLLAFLNGIGASLIAGHIINAPSVSTIFSAIIILLLVDKKSEFDVL